MNKAVVFLLIAGFLVTGCTTNKILKKPINNVDYKIVDTYSDSFNSHKELREWYLDNYKLKGKHTKNLQGSTYILISLGEKRSGGYKMEVTSIEATDKILVNTNLIEPSPDELKTMIITYPHLLLAIKEDVRNIVWENTVSKP